MRFSAIGLVVLLDVVEIVEVVDHDAVRLPHAVRRRSAEEIDLLQPRAIAEMEARDRIDRQAARDCAHAGNTRRPPASAAPRPARGSPAPATSLRCRDWTSASRSSCVSARDEPDARSRFEPAGEARHRRQRDEGLEPRIVARNLLHHLLDQEIAEGHAGKAALAIGDRVEDRGRRLVRHRAARGSPAGSARSSPGFARSARPRRRSAARRPAPDGRTRSSGGRRGSMRRRRSSQLADLVHRLVLDDLFEDIGRRRPVDVAAAPGSRG